MLCDVLYRLQNKRIILASGSPRRIEYLKLSGLNFEVVPSTFPEDVPATSFSTVESYVIFNATKKAREVYERFEEKPYLVIGCDTVVEWNGRVLEKPKSRSEAVKTLSDLSGGIHHVYSGVSLMFGDTGEVITFTEKTEVEFATLSRGLIEAYCDTEDPYDKAGGYGIQSTAGTFISKINGDFYNVTGLPLHKICKYIRDYISV